MPHCLVAQNNGVKADVAISIQQDHAIWAGQQVTINLDLKTTGISFSDSHFNLPEVPGAFLMQTDSTTVKLTENIDGQTWQIIRYPLALYPQQAGRLQIPSIAVRFSTSAGYGSTSMPFEFYTKALDLTVNAPPGVKDGALVITTSSFEMNYQWQPKSETAQTGDAITLTVTRRAGDISGMLLPPLPVFRTAGLAVYPQTPELSDKTNRGSLIGERIDTIIWVLEKPGSYEIPGIRFQWWDPGNRELKQQVIPAWTLDVLSASAVDAHTSTRADEQFGNQKVWLLSSILAALISIVLFLLFARKVPGRLENNEKSAFVRLKKACSSNDIGQTHLALHAWLERSSPTLSKNSGPATLSEFARGIGKQKFTEELDHLQEALITSASAWEGSDLLNSLQGIRRQIKKQKITISKAQLSPLNP